MPAMSATISGNPAACDSCCGTAPITIQDSPMSTNRKTPNAGIIRPPPLRTAPPMARPGAVPNSRNSPIAPAMIHTAVGISVTLVVVATGSGVTPTTGPAEFTNKPTPMASSNKPAARGQKHPVGGRSIIYLLSPLGDIHTCCVYYTKSRSYATIYT